MLTTQTGVENAAEACGLTFTVSSGRIEQVFALIRSNRPGQGIVPGVAIIRQETFGELKATRTGHLDNLPAHRPVNTLPGTFDRVEPQVCNAVPMRVI